jgi:hypothetical protein
MALSVLIPDKDLPVLIYVTYYWQGKLTLGKSSTYGIDLMLMSRINWYIIDFTESEAASPANIVATKNKMLRDESRVASCCNCNLRFEQHFRWLSLV